MNVEDVDLAELTRALRAAVGTHSLEGAVVGRTALRDATASHLGCSDLEAERLVDTLVGRGFLRLERSPEGREVWRLSEGG